MNKNSLRWFLAGLCWAAAGSAVAEDAYAENWYIVPGASVMDADSDLQADYGGSGFIRLGRALSDKFDVQLGVSYARASEDTGIAGVDGKYQQTLLGVDALYMLNRSKFSPFVLTSLGFAHNKVDYSNLALADNSRTSLMAGVGVGFQYALTPQIGLQADLRHVWSQADGQSIANNFDADGVIGNTYFNFGAVFRFSAPPAVPAVTAKSHPAPVAPQVTQAPAEPAPVPPAQAESSTPSEATDTPVDACQPRFETVTISAEKLFTFDQWTLRPESRATLDAVAEKLKANAEVALVLVTGHADRIGTEAYNQKLSERRAHEVKNYLVTRGVDASRLQAVGKGESEPVVACDGVKGRKKLIECLQPNRRVVTSASTQHEVPCP